MLLDAIMELATDGGGTNGEYTVRRRDPGTTEDGLYTSDAAPTTVTVIGSVQPARGLPRITGGRDMYVTEQNQHTVEALVGFFTTIVYERTPEHAPDEISIRGRWYTVTRSERWELDEEVFWVAVLDLQTGGAS